MGNQLWCLSACPLYRDCSYFRESISGGSTVIQLYNQYTMYDTQLLCHNSDVQLGRGAFAVSCTVAATVSVHVTQP